MLQPLFDWIEKLATDFSWRRLIIFLSLLAILGSCAAIYEELTGTFQLGKYEKSISLLESLQKIESPDKEAQVIKSNIYRGIMEVTSAPKESASIEVSFGSAIKQFLAASSIWFIIALFFIPKTIRGDREARNILLGFSLIGALIGGIAYFLPSNWPSWVLFGLFPIGFNLFIFLFLAFIGNRK